MVIHLLSGAAMSPGEAGGRKGARGGEGGGGGRCASPRPAISSGSTLRAELGT